jgi:hypothetical protein
MKRLLSTIMSIMLIQPIHANEFAKLHIKISGALHNQGYFLCINNVGCVNMSAGNQTFPMSSGSINYIIPVTFPNNQAHPQALPKSCAIAVKNNQTITITGSLKASTNDAVYISHLHCKVS